MTAKPRQTIDLDGTPYTARKFTNALRVELGDQLEQRARARSQYNRATSTAALLQRRLNGGEGGADDVDALVAAVDDMETHERALQDSALEVARVVFRDADGKAPTKKLVDDHADLEELTTAVAVALREEEPESPTPAEPAAS